MWIKAKSEAQTVWITGYFSYVDKMEAETLMYVDKKLYIFFYHDTWNPKL